MQRLGQVLVVVIVALFCGCASTSTGPSMDKNDISQIQKGVSTRAQVEQLLGPPTSTSLMGDGRRTMLYFSNQSKIDQSTYYVPFMPFFKGQGSTSRTQQLQIILSKADVVEDYEFSDTTSEMSQSGLLAGNRVETKTTPTK
jgi:outer membrane protein assembly factor BamE (lipoprotein component of BamABCDE complex)